MPTYFYKAKKGISQLLNGQIEAVSTHDALAKIDSLGLFPVSVKEKQASLKMPAKVSLKDLVEFTNQLSTLINSGSTLLSALNTLVTETEHTRIKPVDRKSTRLNSSHIPLSRMPSSA